MGATAKEHGATRGGATARPCHSLRAVVVEDDALFRWTLTDWLLELGIAVVGETDRGSEALALIESERPDLVFLDIRIRGPLDGIETAARIRERFSPAIVLVSGSTDAETLERVARLDRVEFVRKPPDRTALKAAIERAQSRSLPAI